MAAEANLGQQQMLWKLCEAYAIGNAPNSFTVVATYGHGKSHFAVAVANYFGKALESSEYAAVRESLGLAIGNKPLLGRFTSFKESSDPSLSFSLTETRFKISHQASITL